MKIKIILSLFILVLSSAFINAALQPPEQYFGTAYFDGIEAADGSEIIIKVQSTGEIVYNTTVKYIYHPSGNYYVDELPIESVVDPNDGNANPGDPLVWMINGVVTTTPPPGADTASSDNVNNFFDIYAYTQTCIDIDGDGYGSPASDTCTYPEFDCNDNNNQINPSVTDSTCDNVDNNCDGNEDEDYVPIPTECGIGECKSTGLLECNFGSEINSCIIGAPSDELCDSLDNDCNGFIDDNVGYRLYLDSDSDGFGNLTQEIRNCSLLSGYSTLSTDCNDNNNQINPNATELCDNVDNDCNLATIDGSDEPVQLTDSQFGVCENSTKVCQDGNMINDYFNIPNYNINETCDDVDTNCDGNVDNDLKTLFYFDQDKDGFGNVNVTVNECVMPENYIDNDDDCDDTTNMTYPDAHDYPENNKDENCDGVEAPYVLGSEYSIGGLSNISIFIDGVDLSSAVFSGEQNVLIKNNGTTILEFIHNFSYSTLDFDFMVQLYNSNGYGGIIISNLTLQYNQTKTVYFKSYNEVKTICIDDSDIYQLSSISSGCNDGDSETSVTCNATGAYSCNKNNGWYKVEGLTHSGIIEYGYCGDGIVQSGEDCDGSIGSFTCSDIDSDYDTGTPACSSCNLVVGTCEEESGTGNPSGGSSGGGGGALPPPVDFVNGKIDILGKKSEQFRFNFNNKTYTLKLDNINQENLYFLIYPGSIIENMKVKQTKKIDLDKDNKNDIEVYLEKIISGTAQLSIHLIKYIAPVTIAPVVQSKKVEVKNTTQKQIIDPIMKKAKTKISYENNTYYEQYLQENSTWFNQVTGNFINTFPDTKIYKTLQWKPIRMMLVIGLFGALLTALYFYNKNEN